MAQKSGNMLRMSIVSSLSSLLLCLVFLPFFSTLNAAPYIEEVIIAYLKEHYPWAEIKVDDLSVNGNIEGEIKQIYMDKRPPGRTQFTIQCINGEKLLATANIRAFDWVVMSRRPQGKGHVLHKEDLYRALMDVTKIPRGAIKEMDEAMGRALRRSIIANSPLTFEMLAEGMAVKKGSKVIIIAESPSFIITTAGELRENGYVGSAVRAINLASRKVVKGILIDENTLKVDF